MPKDNNPLIKLADAAFKEAAKTVVARAKQFGTPIIVSRDGKIVELDPHTMRPVKKTRGKRVG